MSAGAEAAPMLAAPPGLAARPGINAERLAGDRGDDAAPPLVCLHGWGLNLRVWDGVRTGLARTRELLLVDLPGHGRSGFIAAAAGLDAQVELLLAALPERMALLGWSLGGQLALALAARAPQRIERLVLVATTPRFVAAPDWPCGMDGAVLAAFAAHLERDYRRTVGEFLELQVRGSRASEASLTALRRALLEHGEGSPDALRAGLEILRTADARGLLPTLGVPVCVIAGQYDRVTPPAAARALAAALPDAAFVELRRAGHAPFLSDPLGFVDCVGRFLARPD